MPDQETTARRLEPHRPYYVGIVNGSRDGAHEDAAHLWEHILTPDPGDDVTIHRVYARDVAEALHTSDLSRGMIAFRGIAACGFCGQSTGPSDCTCWDDDAPSDPEPAEESQATE